MSIVPVIAQRGKSIIEKSIAHRYALDVVSGQIPACKYTIKSCERYLNDFTKATSAGWKFDYKDAQYVIDWIRQYTRHTKGKFKGKNFDLLPWQQFVVWNLFGWKNADGSRRFTSSYIEIPKKNGKTTFASAIMLYMLIGDAEDSPEVYCAATHRDQAKIAFDEASRMAMESPQIKKLTKQVRNNIACPANYGKMVPLSSEANSSDGLNVSCGVIDEYHAHKTSEVYDIVKSGTIARLNPMFLTITTAGFNLGGPCKKLHDTCRKILDGQLEDESKFIIMYSTDEDDPWYDEKTWIKANPSLGYGVTVENLRNEFNTAQNEGGTKITNFQTKFLNQWVGSSATWIPDDKVLARMTEEMPDVTGIACFGGLDLSNVRDIAAFTLRWEFPDGRSYDKTWYWLPEQRLMELSSVDDKHPYINFARDGHIILTKGNTTDYDYIRKHITGYYVDGNVVKYDPNCIMQQYNVHSIAFDRWNSSQLVINLQADGVEMVGYGQGYIDMSVPSKGIEKDIHDDGAQYSMHFNPVTRWMFGNVVMMKDAAGNQKPDKSKSENKIDGIVAMIMAKGRYMQAMAEDKNKMPDNYQLTIL